MYNMSFTPNHTADLVSRYMILTKEIMPQMVRNREVKWPVQNDHCFQRIVLDAICNGHWHKYLAPPAYKHLTHGQAVRVVQLCEDIVTGRVNLYDLNRQSLIWRGKRIP
jgi:hypothetical protein|tara:strand:- start:358 stop:684 length:327 start_codon:yes stop_codon:yes gene_type:complete